MLLSLEVRLSCGRYVISNGAQVGNAHRVAYTTWKKKAKEKALRDDAQPLKSDD